MFDSQKKGNLSSFKLIFLYDAFKKLKLAILVLKNSIVKIL